MNWTESRDACVTIGGHLVIINSQQEMDFLKAKRENHWIGLTDAQEEGKWRWVDNTPLTNPKLVLGPHAAR
ncbi:C-type lectin domain family 4 member E-like [Clupea harengus]|uniref:C-type lectin domain family 4 member E-like n=1 Tax=Clupea harengus TaxID=7950 RepID=A0A6P8GS16_CLUHA|nr:C-type lectin domain family 4 member E-like [Clupea harengus]